MAKLIINPTSGAKKEIPVAGKIVSIGRDPSNDLVLSDAMVSRRHAILERRGDDFVIRDNGSSNGTLVNGDRVVGEQPLGDGDLIAIGSARLLFASENAAEPPPPVAGPLATQPMPVTPASPTPVLPPSAQRPPARAGLSCVDCGAQASPFDKFCRQCGAELPDSSAKQIACKSCSAVVMLPAKFCGACGKVLLSEVPRPDAGGPAQQFVPPPQAQPQPASHPVPAEPGRLAPSVQPAQPQPVPVAQPSAPQPAPIAPPAPAHPSRPSGPMAEPARRTSAPERAAPTSVPAEVEDPGDALGVPPDDGSPVGRISGSVVTQPERAEPAEQAEKAEQERTPAPIRQIRSSPRAANRRPATAPQAAMGRPAGFWIRFGAYSVDSAIISLPVIVATGVWAFLLMEQGTMASLPQVTPSMFLLPIIGGIATLVLSFVYPVYFWAVRGATPGKKILGLNVVTMSGETPIGWRRAILRVMGYTINSFVLGIGFLLIAVSDDKRGLHDRLADTCVVSRS